MRDVEEMARREVARALGAAADGANAAIEPDAVAFVSQPLLFVAAAPAAALRHLDVASLLAGNAVLQNAPLMYWYVTGELLRGPSAPLAEGFYAVVADQQRGVVEVRDVKGEVVGVGDLDLCIEPPSPPTTVARDVKIHLDSPDYGFHPPHVKICGTVTIRDHGITVKAHGCTTISL
jgi:hypothetical protein